MTIIERILQEAEKKNIKQSNIAKHIGKNNNQITSWKERNCNPPAEYIPPIAELLGVSISWLMTGTESTPQLRPVFPEDEQQLLDYYGQCSQEGKNRIMEQAELLSARYPKSTGKSSEYKIG